MEQEGNEHINIFEQQPEQAAPEQLPKLYVLAQNQFQVDNVIFDIHRMMIWYKSKKIEQESYGQFMKGQEYYIIDGNKVKKNSEQFKVYVDQFKQKVYTQFTKCHKGGKKLSLGMLNPQYVRFVTRTTDQQLNVSSYKLEQVQKYYGEQSQIQKSIQIKHQILQQEQTYQQKQKKKCLKQNNAVTRFYKSFFKVQFKYLTFLNLSKNNITSIESLAHAQIPNLQNLKIFGNQITSLNCLRKCDFKKLSFLAIYNNPILYTNGLSQGKFNQLQQIQFDGFETPPSNYNNYQNFLILSLDKHKKNKRRIIQDISFIYKLQNVSGLIQLKIQDPIRVLITRQQDRIIKKLNTNYDFQLFYQHKGFINLKKHWKK